MTFFGRFTFKGTLLEKLKQIQSPGDAFSSLHVDREGNVPQDLTQYLDELHSVLSAC